MIRHQPRGMLLASLLALFACADPPVQSAADRAHAPLSTTLSGQVILQGSARGDVLVLLYEAAHPPPPFGSGHPRSFVQLPAASVFQAAAHDASQLGPFAAEYTFPEVEPGTYLVAALLDRDDCLTSPSPSCQLSDFDPFYLVTREPNGGDLLGGHVDAHGQLAPVVVPAPDVAQKLAPVTGVQVVVGADALPDRPVFSVALDAAHTDAQGDGKLEKAEPTFLELQAAALNLGPVDERQPVFFVRYVDDDHDGVPDLGALGTPLLWPKVFLRKIADPDPARFNPAVAAGLRDENDLDDDGVLDATGTSYDHLVGGAVVKADAAPDLVLIPTTFIADPAHLAPIDLYPRLALPDGGPDLDKVLPLANLKVAVLPQAVDASGATPVPLAALPPGKYAVVVEQFTGQTWRLPNELAPASARALGLTGDAAQGFRFVVAP